ncbi:hypothetical protein JHK86_016029 [Glycine max]|nr:hypothetical protein JHK86_016029 [Glycine max]
MEETNILDDPTMPKMLDTQEETIDRFTRVNYIKSRCSTKKCKHLNESRGKHNIRKFIINQVETLQHLQSAS